MPKYTTDIPEAVVREVADALTLLADEGGALRTFIDTTNVGGNRWEPPLVDEDWDANLSDDFPRARGSRIRDHALQIQGSAPSGQMEEIWRQEEGQGTLLSLKEANDKGIDCCDLGRVQKIQTRSHIMVDPWAIHLKSPTVALASALERTEQTCGMASSATRES